jgi:hypothetical protein
MNIRSLGAAALLLGTAATLSGCDTLRNAAGMDKSAPDEFAVLTKAPLVIPPDYNLKPPRPGAVPTNQVEPTDTAQMTLFGNDPATIASQLPSTYSESEKLLLANAGIQNIDPQIREHLASDYKNMQGADEGFTNDILFWQKPKPDTGTPLDADKELSKKSSAPEGKPAAAPKPQEDKGWFDGWFDWF